MAYAERRERQKGVRYRGIYKAADGRYRSAGTFSTEERALEVAKEAERRAAEAIQGAAGGLDPGIRATRTIKEYAPLFLRHHRVEGNTKDTYADTLRLHVVPFLGGCRVAETDRTVARNYVTTLQEEGRSANTIRQAKVVLCAMFGMAVADGYVDYNPFHDVKIPKVPGRRAIKVATPEQYLTVRACLPTRPAQVFSTLLVSSVRIGEAIKLTRHDADLDAGVLTVVRGKHGASRHVPLHPSTVAMLRRYAVRRDRLCPAPATDRFFITSAGTPLSAALLEQTFTRLLVQAQITAPPGQRRPRIHDIRHSLTVAT